MTTSYTPEQNGVLEWKKQTVVETARSMMNATTLPKQFWAEAVATVVYILNISVATVVYILNISPTKVVLNRTLYKVWISRKPRVIHLKVFGYIAYALDKSPSRRKLDAKSEKCIFVGNPFEGDG